MALAHHDTSSVRSTGDSVQQLLERCRALEKRMDAASKKGIRGLDINHEKRRRDAIEFFAMWLDDAETRLNRAMREVSTS
jgi:predicted deacetylase